MNEQLENIPWMSPNSPYLRQGEERNQLRIGQSGVSPNASSMGNHRSVHSTMHREVLPQQLQTMVEESKLSLHARTLLEDLKALKDGWAGPQTVAPSSIIISKLSEILGALELDEEEMPSIQIDDDGALTLIWKISKIILCSIDILKDGKLICVYSELCEGPAKSRVFSPSNIQEILDFHRDCINRV